MKNADDMLKRIMEEVDRNGDGKIQYNGTQPVYFDCRAFSDLPILPRFLRLRS
jgi:hypothetical protein